jgi:hypothetical protein
VLVLPMLLLLPLRNLLQRLPSFVPAKRETQTASASQTRVRVLLKLLPPPLWTLLLRPMRLPHFASALIVVESPLKGLRSMHS